MSKVISNTPPLLYLYRRGTLKVLLEAKSQGLIDKVEPFVTGLNDAGLWISAEIKQRILILAGEFEQTKAG
jgi:predicted nucleic acid-binding protein